MRFNRSFINVIGCGYAGIECALFLAGHGHKVHIKIIVMIVILQKRGKLMKHF